MTLLLMALNVVVSLVGFSALSSPTRRRSFVFVPYQVARGQNLVGLGLSHFAHADPGHLVVNMVGLYFFGPTVETLLGGPRLLLVYALSGAVATLAIFLMSRKNPRHQVLGASGSVSGVVFAAIVLVPTSDIYLLFVPIPIPAPVFGVLYVVLSTYLMGRQDRRIAHEAHLGGAAAGFLLAGLLAPAGFRPLLERLKDLLG